MDDVKSQTGAFKNLKNAKKSCKVGYSVFDENGTSVFTAEKAHKKGDKITLKNVTLYASSTAKSGMIQCGGCGKNYQRKVYKNKIAWNCSTFTRRGKKYCPIAKQIPENILHQALCDVLEIKEFDEKTVHKRISRIIVPAPYELIFIFHDGHEEKRKWEHISRSKSWTDEMKQKARERSLQCQGKSQ